MGPVEQRIHERAIAAKARLGVPARVERRVPRAEARRPLLILAIEEVDPAPEPSANLNMLDFPGWRFLTELAALKHGLTAADIHGRRNSAHIVLARHEAWWLIYSHTSLSLPQIGKRFGRDHSTIYHGLNKFGRRGGERRSMTRWAG